MAQTPLLRTAGPGDAEVMSETVAICFDGYREFAPPGWQPPDVQGPVELARMCARLEVPSTWAVIAEDGGEVAGHAAFVPQQGVDGSAHLWQLFLRPPWWGSGLARELLERAVTAAVERG